MGRKLYIVVYIKEKQWLGNGVVYIGDSKYAAEKIHEETEDTVIYEFDIKDKTVFDFSHKIKARKLEEPEVQKSDTTPWHLKKKGKK